MTLADSKVFQGYMMPPSEGNYDFYRCYKCRKVFTRQEEIRRFRASASKDENSVTICGCGSKKYSPAFPKRLEWARVNVLSYTLKLALARGLAPWADRHMPALLPLIEQIVQI